MRCNLPACSVEPYTLSMSNEHQQVQSSCNSTVQFLQFSCIVTGVNESIAIYLLLLVILCGRPLVAYSIVMTQLLQSANTDAWPMQAPATSVAIVPAVSVSLSSSELQMLTTYATRVQRWGWRWRLSGSDNTAVLLTHLGCVLAATMNAFDLQASFCSSKTA